MKNDDRQSGGSGTAGRGIENEGTGSLRVPDKKNRGEDADLSSELDETTEESPAKDRQGGSAFSDRKGGSGSTKSGSQAGVSGKRGVTGGTEKEGEGHSGPIRSGQKKKGSPQTEQDQAEGGAREGYEDHGGSRDEDGTQGESSGSRPGYR